jgi:hypothetical protein
MGSYIATVLLFLALGGGVSWVSFADHTTGAHKFSLEYSATEFAKEHGFSRYVCTFTKPVMFNPCLGLLDKGKIVDFECRMKEEEFGNECRLTEH